MKTFIIFVSLLLLHLTIAFAENPYIREGSIGKQQEQTKSPSKNPSSFRPIEEWVGEKFIFLPKPKSLQEYGYLSFKGGSGRFNQPTYEECVGRTGTIIKVTKEYSNRITIQMDDNKQIYIGWGDDCIDGIAPIADIDYARNKWSGKTLWLAQQGIFTYNETTGKSEVIELKKFLPVKVVDVVAGAGRAPVRFILQTPSGEEGFVDMTLSGTNISYILKGNTERFSDHFFTENPKKIYKWSSKVWSAIEVDKIFIGMTAKQVCMTHWKNPKEINTTRTGNVTREQWVYGSRIYLYFENGVLTGIQN